MKSHLYYNLKVVFTYSGVTPYFPYANTPLSHLGLGLFSVLSHMMQLSTETMISIQSSLPFLTQITVKSFILLAGISSFALRPQSSFTVYWGRKWDYVKGIPTTTLEFLTTHADEQYWISSRIPLCDPTEAIPCWVTSTWKHSKENVPQLTADLWCTVRLPSQMGPRSTERMWLCFRFDLSHS